MAADKSIVPPISARARDLVFVDTETTGLDPFHHEIIEIAARRMSPDLRSTRAKIEIKTIMQWPDRAHPKALEVNGYTAEEWRSATTIRTALIAFAELFEGEAPIIVGHNVAFDWDFIREAYRREGIVPPQKKYLIDTASLAWPLVVGGHIDNPSLEKLCSKYGIANTGAHRAMADVDRCMLAYEKMLGLNGSTVRT